MGVRLLRGFDEEAKGNTEAAVLAGEAAHRAGFNYGSEDYEAALHYLLDFGYLRPAAVVGGGRCEPGATPDSFLIPCRRTDEKCPECSGEMGRTKISGRSAYYCPACQSEG